MLVFAVESSCDETSVCIMDDNKKIYSHIIYSQEIHKKFGGVVPELASRAHLEILQKISDKAFLESKLTVNDIDFFAATCGPGLLGPLLIGSTFTKSLAIGCGKPFIPINHIQSHIFSPTFNNNLNYPHLSLLITGGHTQIYYIDNEKKISLLSESVDDALGETFDKIAKILGLPYPGGPEIEKRANEGSAIYNLPTPSLKDKSMNMSFSGIKTAVNILVKQNDLNEKFVSNICSSFQLCVLKVLLKKISECLESLKTKSKTVTSMSIVGGVSNNAYIRNEVERHMNKKNIKIYFPINEMMTDNAAMIAWMCIISNKKNDLFFNVNPRLTI